MKIFYFIPIVLIFSMLESKECVVRIPIESVVNKKGSPKREYFSRISSEEKKNIRYIVNTLGMKSLITISGARSSLKDAGDKIDHIHPLRFLGYILSDEEMKASMKAMVGRSWVWKEFIDQLTDTLKFESERNNIKPEYIQDFVSKIGINADVIMPSFNQKDWVNFVVTAIDKVPRSTHTDRYNDF